MRISVDLDELDSAARALSADRDSLERVTLLSAPSVVPEIAATRRFDQALGALTRGLHHTRGRVAGELDRFADALWGVVRDVSDAEAERVALIRGIARGREFAL